MSDIFATPVGSMPTQPFMPYAKDDSTKPAPTGAPPPVAGPPAAGTKPAATTGSFNFTPTYQDYLGANPQNNGGSEGGSFSGFTQDQWNAMTPEQQWAALSNGLAIAPSDPRYAALAQQLGISDNRDIRLGWTDQSHPFTSDWYTDPSAVLQGNGVFATDDSNLTPAAQFAGGGMSDAEWVLAALGVVGGGAIAGNLLGDAGAAAGADGGLMGPPEIVGPPAELAPPPVDGVPPPVDVPPPAGVPPPDGAPPPIEAPPPALPPATVADNLTPGIDNLITPPPDGLPPTVPPPDPGLFPPPSGLPENPDFPINLAPPPDVTVPPPAFNVDTPWYDPMVSGVTKNPLGALSAGVGIYGALTRPKPPAINNTVPETNKPVIDQAISDILHRGALSPDQQHLIDSAMDQHIREGTEALRQRAINSGMGADSMVTQQQINKFTDNAELVRGQLYQQQMQQNIGNAISVWSEGNREDIAIQTAAAQLAAENNREISALNQSIAQSLGWLYAMSNSRTAPPTFPGG